MCDHNRAESSYDGPTTPLELRDQISEENDALRAFAVLLSTANLSEFDSSKFLKDTTSGRRAALEAQALQYGLAKLIDLYLDRQERMVNAFAEHYLESDEWRLQTASKLVQMVRGGAWGSGQLAQQKLLEAVNLLSQVIACGGHLRPMAEDLQQEAFQHPLLKAAAEEVAR